MNTRPVDKQRTRIARVLHEIGVARLNELFAYDPAISPAQPPRHAQATPRARQRRETVRVSRRTNRR